MCSVIFNYDVKGNLVLHSMFGHCFPIFCISMTYNIQFTYSAYFGLQRFGMFFFSCATLFYRFTLEHNSLHGSQHLLHLKNKPLVFDDLELLYLIDHLWCLHYFLTIFSRSYSVERGDKEPWTKESRLTEYLQSGS